MGAFDDMQVGQDEASWIDDDSAAQRVVFLDDFLLHAAQTEEIEIREEVVIAVIDFYKCFRSNIYDPWKGVCHGLHDRRCSVAQRFFLRYTDAGGHAD